MAVTHASETVVGLPITPPIRTTDLVEIRHNTVRKIPSTSSAMVASELSTCTREAVQNVHQQINEPVSRMKTEKWFKQTTEERRQTKGATDLLATAVFGICSSILPPPEGWLFAGASTVISTATIWEFLASQKPITESGNLHSPPLHMHDLMNWACMEVALSGDLKVYLPVDGGTDR